MSDVSWDPPGPGPWLQDRAHLPVSCTALLGEIYPENFSRGFQEALAPWGALLDDMLLRYVNGFPFLQLVPFDAPGPDGPPPPEQLGAEIGRRTELAAAAFENKIWRDSMQAWDEEIKPAAIARHQALADVDLIALDTEGLRGHLHECIAHLGAMWYQHHRFNIMTMAPVGDFLLHAAGWTGRPPSPMATVYDGWSPVSGVIPPELAPAVEALRADANAAGLLEGATPPEERMAELRASVPAVDEYMRVAGYRLSAGFDLTNPTIGERPDVVLDRLRNALDREDTSLERAAALATEIRAAVPAEHHAEFDDLLAESRYVYRLRDERGLYSDSAAVGLLRLALIELGRRLFEAGRINFMYDTLDVTSADIDSLLDGAPSPTADELSARVARRKSLSAAGAPPLLGPPPPPPPPVDELPPPLARVMSAIGFAIDGILGELDAPEGDEQVVIGIGGSEGSAEGPARIVKNFDDLMLLDEGEVLITTATGESFNAFLHLVAAVVTDHGSFASHAAIMGREMGFPSVVGTTNATSRIANGDRVRVDGASGTVTILPS
jgi:phosphohistidine swiveling domain-containing protein